MKPLVAFFALWLLALAARADVIEVSATVLSAAYGNNEIAADAIYKDHDVVVTGTVQSVAKDALGTPYVILGRNIFEGVRCLFAPKTAQMLSSLSKGQEIAVTGKVKGKDIQVVVADCDFIMLMDSGATGGASPHR